MSTRDELLARHEGFHTCSSEKVHADLRAALATPPEPLDVERWMTARHTALHPQNVYGGEGCACPEERESVIAIAAEYARLSAQEDAP